MPVGSKIMGKTHWYGQVSRPAGQKSLPIRPTFLKIPQSQLAECVLAIRSELSEYLRHKFFLIVRRWTSQIVNTILSTPHTHFLYQTNLGKRVNLKKKHAYLSTPSFLCPTKLVKNRPSRHAAAHPENQFRTIRTERQESCSPRARNCFHKNKCVHRRSGEISTQRMSIIAGIILSR